MASGFKLTGLDGPNGLDAHLRRLAPRAVSETMDVLRDAGEDVRAAIKPALPRRTGAFQDSGKVSDRGDGRGGGRVRRPLQGPVEGDHRRSRQADREGGSSSTGARHRGPTQGSLVISLGFACPQGRRGWPVKSASEPGDRPGWHPHLYHVPCDPPRNRKG